VLGDFNAIRASEERKGVGNQTSYGFEITRFNDFILQDGLLDIPVIGRKYTWYELNGTTNSRIDRILVSRDLLDCWPGSKQYVLG